MKKLIFAGLVFSISVMVFGQLQVSVGPQAGYNMATLTNRLENIYDSSTYAEIFSTDKIVSFGAFIDAKYLRIYGEYAMSLGATSDAKLVIKGQSQELPPELLYLVGDSSSGYSWTMINVSIIGKYPIDLGRFIIWPAAGIFYSKTLSMDADGDGTEENLSNYDIDDIYACGGIGIDIFIKDKIFLSICGLFNWNLTPVPAKNYYLLDGESFTGYAIIVRAGVGIKLR